MPLSASQIAVYEADFRKFDVDGSGTLEMQDIAEMLTFRLQRQCTEDELQQYMAEVHCNTAALHCLLHVCEATPPGRLTSMWMAK